MYQCYTNSYIHTVSSNKPKIDTGFFVDLPFCTNCKHEFLCQFAEQAEQF